MSQDLIRSSLESPSTSSISTDVSHIELKVNSPRTPTHLKQRDSFDSNRNRTPTNDNLNINKSISSETPIKTVRVKSPSAINASSRSFIALFDYDPHAMSPNQDNDEELPFKQGQIIKVKFIYLILRHFHLFNLDIW
jgi:hypothetical protein